MFERLATSKTAWLGLAGIVLGILGNANEGVANFMTMLSLPDPGTCLSGGAVLIGLRDAMAKIEGAAKS